MGFFLILLIVLLASCTSLIIFSGHQGTQKRAGIDKRTYVSITSFIYEFKMSIKQLLSKIHEKYFRKLQISLALSLIASLSALFQSGCG